MRQAEKLGGLGKGKLALAGAAAMSLIAAQGAWAASPKTFAQFHELTTGNPSQFSYFISNFAQNGPPIFAALTADSVPVSFSFEGLPGLAGDLQGNQAATLTLTSVTNQPAISLAGGALADEQFPVTPGTVDTLSITRDTPAGEGAGTMTNLLTLTFSAQLIASPGGNTAQLTGQSALGYTVDYSSDFLNFNNAGVQNFALSLSSWVTTADGGGVEIDPSMFFADATAAGSGTFDTTFVPEPCSLGLAALGIPMILARRRRAAK